MTDLYPLLAVFLAAVLLISAIAFFKDPPQTRSERIQIAMLYAFGVSFVTMLLFFPPVPSSAPQPPAPEPFTYSAAEFRVGYDISDTQPLAYIKDSQGGSPLPIDRIEEHPGPRELIVEGDWVTLRLPQEKE